MAVIENTSMDLSWGACKILIAENNEDQSPVTFEYLKQGTVTITSEPGETKEVYATGGRLVGFSQSQPKIVITAEIIEPQGNAKGYGNITTNVESDEKYVTVYPTNGDYVANAYCAVSYEPKYSDQEGYSVILRAEVTSYFAIE